jgi:hypothetical protein
MAVKKPGFNNTAGSRNRRTNRFVAGNREARRHRELAADTLAFVSPDQITDTADLLARFELAEVVEAYGSVAQDGPYEVATVVVGQLDMVEQTITAESAGADIILTSRNNRIESRLS